MTENPNGQPGRAELVARWRSASAQLYAAGTACFDAANDILSTGVRPGMAQLVYDHATTLRDLSRELSFIERIPRDNRTADEKEHDQ